MMSVLALQFPAALGSGNNKFMISIESDVGHSFSRLHLFSIFGQISTVMSQ